ncbi:MAG TPA: hypothetical protein VFV69_09465 [Steroidobacteraceae bacterium]|nr:hypothetical protein [Steroidobacteraceae bacterium]
MSAVRVVLVLVLLACALADSGCSSMQRWLSRDESERRAARLQEVQLKVMRYADDYSGRIRDPLEALNRQAASPEERLAAHDWRIMQSTAAYTIASGPNPMVNALDMIVLASLSRMVVEDSAVGGLSGARTAALLQVHRDLEQQAWVLVDGVADSDQMNHLRALIVQWRAEHPGARTVSQVRLADFASIPGQRSDAAHGGGGVFALIGLDPLSNLDPAVKELEQTRLLAERTIYYLQRAPSLLDMQIERLAYQLAIMPEAKQTLAGVERVSIAAEALGDLTADAPTIIARERHALVADLTATLQTEQARLQALLVEVRGVLQAGAQTSESVGATIAALDTFVARFQRQNVQLTASAAPARPFDINDYAQTARELGTAAQDLQALLVQLDTSSTGIERLAGTTTQALQDIVDRAFWRGLLLIGALTVAALFAALAYRYVAALLPRARA